MTFSLIGLFNGNTAATSVGGAPSLTTNVTSNAPPGQCPIALGTIASANHSCTKVNRVPIVIP